MKQISYSRFFNRLFTSVTSVILITSTTLTGTAHALVKKPTTSAEHARKSRLKSKIHGPLMAYLHMREQLKKTRGTDQASQKNPAKSDTQTTSVNQ